MKLIIAGGRDYWLTREQFARLDVLHRDHGITQEVCGLAGGADACGKVWAILSGIPQRDFPADWKTHGRKAGPFRNQEMALYADALAVFPGNKGTRDMVEAAQRQNLKIFDFR